MIFFRLLESGDTLVVALIDRAFRSALDALTELDKLHQRGQRLGHPGKLSDEQIVEAWQPLQSQNPPPLVDLAQSLGLHAKTLLRASRKKLTNR